MPIILEYRFVTEFSVGDHIVVGKVIKAYRDPEEFLLAWFNSGVTKLNNDVYM
ncbi:MAG: flavin reductase family protein [Desulfurococcaceae archaeon]|nr:flavin reductase family protein [Desulfurococcaceae archaeon]